MDGDCDVVDESSVVICAFLNVFVVANAVEVDFDGVLVVLMVDGGFVKLLVLVV